MEFGFNKFDENEYIDFDLKKRIDELEILNKKLEKKNKELYKDYKLARNDYNQIVNSRTWKISKPIRIFSGYIHKFLRSNKVTYNFCRLILSVHRIGIKRTWIKISKIINKPDLFKISQNEFNDQRNTKFNKDITISVLVPLYNTPINFLNDMINSVINQTYSNWELCLADGSDVEHGYVADICANFAHFDSRIKYKKLEKNEGISENTNRCIEMSSGDYIGLFDHDDLLHPTALFEVMRVICNDDADFIYTDETTFDKKTKNAFSPNFKPDFAPDNLRSQNYICHFSVFSRELLNKTGMFRKEFDGSQDYDMILRLTENAKHITHIPKILYFWRAHSNSVALDIEAKPYAIISAKKAIAEHLERVNLKGKVLNSSSPSTYKIDYEIIGNPKISIIIPNKDHIDDLNKCLYSIFENTTYNNFEIIIIENNSEKNTTFEYYEKIQNIYGSIKIVTWDGEFNYSAINNYGFTYSSGEYIILLNNDIEVITPGWIQEMLMFAQRKDVGAVGAMLYYPDDTIQHAGVILGIGGVAGHSHKYFKKGELGYMSRISFAQDLSAVTAACMMVPRRVFVEVNGLDEHFQVAFNDVDLCMRIRQKDYLIVFTPYAELYHYESKSRGFEDTADKQIRFGKEISRFQNLWGDVLEKGDPYYNCNLTLITEDFSLKD